MNGVPQHARLPADDQPCLSVRLLGTFELRVKHDTVTVPFSCQRLIAWLALSGRTTRSRVAGALWPNFAERRALANLRTGIWRTNQALPGLVIADQGCVDLKPDVQVDVQRVVASARRLLDDEKRPHMGELNMLTTQGDLLPDWNDSWLDVERYRLRQLTLHTYETAAARLCDIGNHGLALESALAALRADPLRESAYRSVIRVHIAEGNVGEARRMYAECAAVLARDLEIAPSFDLPCPLSPIEQARGQTYGGGGGAVPPR